MYATFSCFQTMIWLPVWNIFNVHMYVVAHRGGMNAMRESALKADCGKNPLPHSRNKPKSALRLAFWFSALPAHLFISSSSHCHTVVLLLYLTYAFFCAQLQEMAH